MPPFSRSRRHFLQLSALAGASFCLGLPRIPAFGAGPPNSFSPLATELDDGPFARVSASFSSTDFNGDNAMRPHEILWRIEEYIASKGGRPAQAKSVNVVVVGGGMAGLLSAYFLQDQNPVLIEQDPRFGGNSKGETYEGNSYSLGAAYITVPEEGDDISRMLADVGLSQKFRHEPEQDARVIYQGPKSLWSGETGAGNSAKIVGDELRRIYEHAYPEIPWSEGDPLSLEELKAWDKETAAQWLRRIDPNLHPHIEEYFQLYCWSSFGGSLDELSAAQFVNFVSSETEGVLAFPGGNAAITDALHRKLKSALAPGCLCSNSIVLDVKETDGGVEVLYEDRDGKLQRLQARSVVMAAPKYVARAIMKGVSAERSELWRTLPYRAYTVSNVLLKEKVPSLGYDLFCLQGKVPDAPTFGRRTDRPIVDFVYADWANHDQGDRSILSIYRPYAFDGARSGLVSASAHQRVVGEATKNLPGILRQIGVNESAIEGVRVTRWGHAIPLAQAGFISDGTVEKLSAPQGRIFFANQDNYMNPAFESAFTAAQRAAEGVRAALRT